MTYVRPKNLTEALNLLSGDEWSLLSGGTDFYPSLRDQPFRGKVIDLWGLDELREIRQEQACLRIGALATWSDLIRTKLPPAFDGLKLAAREVGSVQIQNRGTVAGNICNASPAADGVPPLLTLDAVIELVSCNGVRLVPLNDFIVGNRATSLRADELVSAVLVPNAASAGQSSFLKLGSRKYLVISISMVAARLECDAQGVVTAAAVGVGSCSVVAQRLGALEQALVGQLLLNLADQVRPEHLAPLAPIDDIRASGPYRTKATHELLKRVLSETGEKFSG
ncbi:MAG: FAD binding domain-containing protein [Granulosicoccus sp.]|nr:FAD binding domain-containing protein [Granulosicoccus sp.]